MRVFIIIALVAVLIAACTPQEEICLAGEEDCDDTTTQPTPPQETPPTPPQEIPPTPPVEDTTPPEIPEPAEEQDLDIQEPAVPALPTEIQTAFEKALSSTSYSYKFQGPPDPTEYYDVFVKGNKMKVLLPKGSQKIRSENFDTVYIDLSANTAVGYCERETLYCEDGPGITTDPAIWTFKTPLDWINEINEGELVGSENINGRNAYRLEYTQDEILHTVFIDTFFGIPLQVKIGEDNKGINDKITIYDYKSASVNTVTDPEVIHG